MDGDTMLINIIINLVKFACYVVLKFILYCYCKQQTPVFPIFFFDRYFIYWTIRFILSRDTCKCFSVHNYQINTPFNCLTLLEINNSRYWLSRIYLIVCIFCFRSSMNKYHTNCKNPWLWRGVFCIGVWFIFLY